ncbi:PREDICTED: uncharacterized protein LOC100634549 [Amphimedon queenslandica]|uniref:HhH-GPD domain-containing protein n=1 Tax=Amphimedon queenslandica TaxID=400682 RepID=A0A1X7VT75_AMPQE|nr:PREDICTED: uncharacterized protein LOC100634549 [Amphimedon queenslandica]|eukprot:XP_003382942.1 PREDICTED: uncharacterized protein LOC100634549 [Amphimedon queenslandica]
MAACKMENLMLIEDKKLWQKSLDVYKDIVELISEQKVSKSKRKVKKEDTLSHLDKWYQEELTKSVLSRDPPHFNSAELCQLMKWKLTRGKFRPRLTDLVKENTEKNVMDITTKAFSLLPNVRKAIEMLTKLKAVGPATASALLCTVAPHVAPFMSDESTQSVPGIGPLNYSLKQYLDYAEALQEKARDLGKSWDAHKVELALWSHHFAMKLKPELLHTETSKEEEEEEERTDAPASKKQKLST